MFNSAALRPIARSALTSGVIMASGDLIFQKIRQHNLAIDSGPGSVGKLDYIQPIRFGIVGLTLHGPYFHQAFQWLERTFGQSKTLKQAFIKTMAGQCTVFPLYVATFYVYMGLLEGHSFDDSIKKVQRAFFPTILNGTWFWTGVNMINFMVVPMAGRILYVNTAGLFWNSYLSYTNSTKAQISSANSVKNIKSVLREK